MPTNTDQKPHMRGNNYMTTELVNTLRLRQTGHHFTDDIFKCIFLYENCCIYSIQTSLKSLPKDSINNGPVSV